MNSWIIVPAAGVGSRFGGDMPKQYQLLHGKPIIEHTLERLLAVNHAQAGSMKIVVAVSNVDTRWQQLPVFQNTGIQTVLGGNERADTVRLALEYIQDHTNSDDWVLVHDVARPCVRVDDIQNLIKSLANHDVGGVLATPVSDTLKRVLHKKDIAVTEDRSQLWAAQTPQMFRYGLLLESLQSAEQAQWQPTDESAAIERLGYTSQVVEGSRDNIKITRLEDMAIAEAIMTYQQEH